MENHRKKIVIHYFALLREQRGCASEEVETAARTPLELYRELRGRYDFSLSGEALQVAVNDEFRAWDVPLADRDAVAFLPPVAGG